ncbi:MULTISPECIES: hypothetical protein [Halomonadaceae]|uniref:hypothetical protein n=1 Tax=Halomonadaceae TaxID=28256 RepID=UPI000C324A69|nr:hypothetical protein [Halomonas sp. MES3-P3E]PKG47718.1 hypothetical protein CXF87_19380 [Halomonas sp. MES3-P3E]|tara:strand:+ start:296 stop:703 length:408 start_codon:yes stop_codon:yes gene_type:complete
MKINVEFDLTPDEFRQSLGLPDVEAFQKNLLENIQRQMESGVEGYDPMSLMRPFLQQPMMQQGLSQGLANFGTYQQMMLDMLRQAGSASASSAHSNDDEKSGGASSKSNSESATSSKAKSTASSRSRSESKRSGT